MKLTLKLMSPPLPPHPSVPTWDVDGAAHVLWAEEACIQRTCAVGDGSRHDRDRRLGRGGPSHKVDRVSGTTGTGVSPGMGLATKWTGVLAQQGQVFCQGMGLATKWTGVPSANLHAPCLAAAWQLLQLMVNARQSFERSRVAPEADRQGWPKDPGEYIT